MINVKDQVYRALESVVGEKVPTDIYPQEWEKFPVVQYTEEANNVFEKTDEGEMMAQLIYRVDVWHTGSTSQLALDIDAALSKIGLTRTACSDSPDPSGLRHKTMRYEGVIDERTEVVYWYGNR